MKTKLHQSAQEADDSQIWDQQPKPSKLSNNCGNSDSSRTATEHEATERGAQLTDSSNFSGSYYKELRLTT